MTTVNRIAASRQSYQGSSNQRRAAWLAVLMLSATQSLPALSAAKRRAASSAAPVVAAQPRNPAEMNNLAVQLGQRGNFEQAVNWHAKALELDPYNNQFRTNLSAAFLMWGKQLLGKRDFNGAISKFHMAIYVDAGNREAEERLNDALKAKGLMKGDEFAAHLEQYGKLDSDGNYPEAIAEARVMVHMRDDGPSHYNLGLSLMKKGQDLPAKKVEGYAELVTALKKVWDKSPDQQKMLADCHCLLGACLLELAEIAQQSNRSDVALKRLSNAGVEFRRAVTVEPNMSAAYQGLKDVANQAVAISPTFNNYLTLASAYQLMGDFEHAKRAFETCYKMDKNNPALAQARRSYYLAVVSAPVPNPQFIASVMSKVEDLLRQNKDDAELLYIFGRGKQALGERDVAIRCYQEAMRINQYVNPKLQANLQALTGGGGASGTQTAAKAGPAGSLGGATGATGGSGTAATGGAAGGAAAPPPVSAALTQKIATLKSKLQSNDLDGAEKLGSDLLNEDAKNAEIWHLMGDVSDKKGDFDQAQANYRMASDLGDATARALLDSVIQKRTRPLVDEGDKNAGSGNFRKALDNYQEASNYDPNSIALHEKIKDMCTHLGDKVQAEKEAKKIEKLKISNSGAK